MKKIFLILASLILFSTYCITQVQNLRVINLGINGLTYSWPASHASGALTNNGSGTLTWSGAGVGGTGTANLFPLWTGTATLSNSVLQYDVGTSSIWPTTDAVNASGGPTNRWKNIYVSNFTILGAGANNSTDLNLSAPFYVSIGSGTGFAVVTTSTNASVASLSAVTSNYVSVNSGKTGSGTYLPLAFFTSGAESGRIALGSGSGTGNFFLGGTTTDLTLTNSNYFITFGSGSGFEAITAATNASVANFSVVTGSKVSLASNKSGAGTYLPLNFEVNGAEVARFPRATNFDGTMMLGGTTSDDAGSIPPQYMSFGNNSGFTARGATSNESAGTFSVNNSGSININTFHTGGGTTLPFKIYVDGAERFRIDTSGTNAQCIWINSGLRRLTLSGSNVIDGGAC